MLSLLLNFHFVWFIFFNKSVRLDHILIYIFIYFFDCKEKCQTCLLCQDWLLCCLYLCWVQCVVANYARHRCVRRCMVLQMSLIITYSYQFQLHHPQMRQSSCLRVRSRWVLACLCNYGFHSMLPITCPWVQPSHVWQVCRVCCSLQMWLLEVTLR